MHTCGLSKMLGIHMVSFVLRLTLPMHSTALKISRSVSVSRIQLFSLTSQLAVPSPELSILPDSTFVWPLSSTTELRSHLFWEDISTEDPLPNSTPTLRLACPCRDHHCPPVSPVCVANPLKPTYCWVLCLST